MSDRFPSTFPVLCGPTAGGKSAAAVALVHLLGQRGIKAEIVTADAFQIYKGMDIGTAKPSAAEREGITHHLIDLVEPTERFTVEQWLRAANVTIDTLRAKSIVPIVVGGTHLYIKALLDGLFDGPASDPKVREQLHAMDPQQRRAELERVDPQAAGRIHFNDVRRTVRALEVYRATGKPISEHQQQWDTASRPDARLFTLVWPTDQLNRRINARVIQMCNQGLLNEVKGLRDAGRLGPQAREALGYKQLLTHLERGGSLLEAIERIKIETRQFGKNQRTWLKRLSTTPGTVPIEAADKKPAEIAQTIVNAWLT